MKCANVILSAIIAVFVPTGVSAETADIHGHDTEAAIEVKTVPVIKEKLYIDTIGFGSGEPNWGGPFVIGHCNGRAISVGYDYNYLMHIVYADGEPILYDGTLQVEADSTANRAVFHRCGKSIDIDFDKPDAIDRLAMFIAPEKGCKRERYTYALGDTNYSYFDRRTTIIADLPTDTMSMRRMLDVIIPYLNESDISIVTVSENIEDENIYDTRRYATPKHEINSFYDLVCAKAQLTRLSMLEDDCCMPLPADSMAPPMLGFVKLVEYIPVLITDTLLTINTVENQTYPTGGCRGSQESYATFATRGDTTICLTAEAIFRPEKFNKVKKVFIEHLSMYFAGTKKPITSDNDENSIYSIYECFCEDNIDLRQEAHQHGYDSCADFVKDNILNNDYSYVRMPQVALLPDGVMMVYDMSWLTDLGEDGIHSLFIPYKALKGCIRPEYRLKRK